jgi:mono/diheme cytochrome c family protein
VGFLRSVPARSGQQPIDSKSAPPRLAEDTPHALGRALFAGACASCHAADGSGRESPYAGLASTRTVNDASGANVTAIILQGAALTIDGRAVYMPTFAGAYSDTEIAALANYVILEFGGRRGRVTPDDVASLRQL